MATSKVIGTCQKRHRSLEFRNFLDQIDASVPSGLDVHIILDNSATHKTALIHRWLAKRPRYNLHFTPTGSSWLNLVERWFAALSEKHLRRGAHRSTRELEEAIFAYIESTKRCSSSPRIVNRGFSGSRTGSNEITRGRSCQHPRQPAPRVFVNRKSPTIMLENRSCRTLKSW